MLLDTRKNWRSVLQHEFSNNSHGFLATMKQDQRWDRGAFEDLYTAMQQACQECAHEDQVERWLASVFFHVPTCVRAWTQQGRFQRPELAYWQQAVEALDRLSCMFFRGAVGRLCDKG